MDYQEKIKEIEKQIKQVEQQANAQLNQLIGKKQMLQELMAENKDQPKQAGSGVGKE